MRNYLDTVKISENEMKSIREIMLSKQQGKAFLDRTEFPKEMNQDAIAGWYKAASDILVQGRMAENAWWKHIAEEYHNVPNIKDWQLDLDKGMMFIETQD